MTANWRLAVIFVFVVVGLAIGMGAALAILQHIPPKVFFGYQGIVTIVLVLGCCGGGAFGLGYVGIKWENWSRKREKSKGSDRRRAAAKKAKRRKDRGR